MLSTATKLSILITKEPIIKALLEEGKTPQEVASFMTGVDIEFIEDLKEQEGL